MNGTNDPGLLPGDLSTWTKRVLEKNKGACANCGSTDRVRAKMIVPTEAGGNQTDTNGVALCRPCDLASGTARIPSSDRRLVNFWVSRELYDWMNSRSGFESMGALVRFLMSNYVADEHRFDDLEQYQDEGSAVKINVWVEADRYATFKALVDKRGLTVTDAFKSLLRMFEAEASAILGKKG